MKPIIFDWSIDGKPKIKKRSKVKDNLYYPVCRGKNKYYVANFKCIVLENW